MRVTVIEQTVIEQTVIEQTGTVESQAASLAAALEQLHDEAAVMWDRDMADATLYLDDDGQPLVGIWLNSPSGLGCVVLDRGDSWAVFQDNPPRWTRKTAWRRTVHIVEMPDSTRPEGFEDVVRDRRLWEVIVEDGDQIVAHGVYHSYKSAQQAARRLR